VSTEEILSKEDLLTGMNELQRQAVLHYEGPALILAGAGSGKTRVITHRIAWLIREHGVSPENILAVTFTNKAASEMKERLSKLLGRNVQGLWVTTFHSMGARILRKHYAQIGLEENFSIYGPPEQTAAMKNVLAFLNLDKKQYNPKHMLDKVSGWKAARRNPADLFETEKNKNQVAVYECYQDELRKSNAVDLEDLLFLLSELFKNHSSVLEFYQNKFRFILVDEYQDTNNVQYELIKNLGASHGNVCVVGDEDQSIYSWRGAEYYRL
jgi:DNA helicase-2/ATP-dependent DNA helicase PcrA